MNSVRYADRSIFIQIFKKMMINILINAFVYGVKVLMKQMNRE